jgi:hypothetical protein
VKPNKRIDTKISTPLFDLPLGAIASHDRPQSLAQRNLLRQLTWSLPSGQDVARAMAVTPLADGDLAELQPYGFQSRTPLWYYVLFPLVLPDEGFPHLRRRRSCEPRSIAMAGFIGVQEIALALPADTLSPRPTRSKAC